MVAVDFDIHAYFGGTTAGLDIGNGVTYDIHPDTRNQRQVTWRKQTVESPWIEGSYDVQAVRGNVTEVVAAWVYGGDQNDLWKNIEGLVTYLDTPSWSILWTIDNMLETWDCTFSDYTVETSKEFMWDDRALVRMNVVRRPRVARTYSDSSQFLG